MLLKEALIIHDILVAALLISVYVYKSAFKAEFNTEHTKAQNVFCSSHTVVGTILDF